MSSAEGPYATCPRCGAPASPDQEYCLECGLRLPFTSSRFARGRRPWYAAPALWSLLALLVLAAIGTAVAVAVTNGEEEQTLTATAPPARAPAPTTTLAPEPTTTAPATAPALPTPSAPTTPVQQRPIEWPDQDGYTVVLESIPTSSSRRRALETARRAIRAGLADVGVLASANYPSLQPGYYVVFTGVYDSTGEAVDALPAATDAGFQAYVRPVSR